jgi:hypothetical protein
MAYSITRNNNTFTLITTSLVYVNTYIQSNCDTDTWTLIGNEQSTSTTLQISLPPNDGLYKIQVTDKVNLDDEIFVTNYRKLLASVVEGVKYILCGCACADCSDCGKVEKDYLSTLLKLLSYNIVNGAIYEKSLLAANTCIKCDILDSNNCMLLRTLVLGNYDNTLLLKKLIAYYYLVYYYTDSVLNTDSTLVKTLYDYDNILGCIKKLGIDTDCIKDAVESVDGIYDVEFNNTFM